MLAWTEPIPLSGLSLDSIISGTRVSVGERSYARAGAAATIEDEWEWVQGARQGHEPSFRLLVDRYRDRVYALALRIAREPEAAEEIAQDAFLRVWQALPAFRGESRFSTWLYQITLHRALDVRSSLARRRQRETPVDVQQHSDTAKVDSPNWELRRSLERLIAELPESPRIIVTLFYGHDQSVDEIARILEIPAATVKTHLFRARAILREQWQRLTQGQVDHGRQSSS